MSEEATTASLSDAIESATSEVYAEEPVSQENSGEIISEESIPEQPVLEEAEPEKVIDMPLSWSQDHKEKWANIPPDLQEYVAQREMDAHKKISEQGKIVSEAKPVLDYLNEAQEVFDAAGVSSLEGVKQLVNFQRMWDQNPAQLIQQLSQAAGLTNQPTDPAMAQLQEQNRQLQAQLRQSANMQKMEVQRQQEASFRDAERQVQEFAADKPDFDKLEPYMAAFVENGDDLQTAYDKARWSVPEIREQLLAEQQKAKVAQAKKASATNLGSPSTANSAGAPDWRSAVRDTVNRVYG